MTKKKVLFNIDLETIVQLNELVVLTKKSRSALVREAVKILWEINKAFQQKPEEAK